MSVIRQTNFGGGEVAPMSWGRNDLPFFGRGLRTMRNFFPTKQHGAAVSRGGSIYLGATRTASYNPSNIRLVPFVFSDTVAYAVEVGVTSTQNLYFRFWNKDGALISNATAFSGAPYELIAGTTTADLHLLKWAQSGNVLTLTHPDWPAQELRRLPNWTTAILAALQAKALAAPAAIPYPITEIDWIALFRGVYQTDADIGSAETAAAAAGETAAGGPPTGGIALPAYTNPYTVAYAASFAGAVNNSPRWTLRNVSFAPPVPYFGGANGRYPVLISPLPTADATHPAREWRYRCSLTVQDVITGRLYETSTWEVTETWPGAGVVYGAAPAEIVVYPDRPVTIRRDHTAGAALNPPQVGFLEVAMNVYRGRGQLFGLIGTTNTNKFIDLGQEPNWLVQPLLGSHPFKITAYSGGVTYGHPSAVSYYQDRLVFLATELRPFTVFASATGDYTNFDRHMLLQVPGEALEFDIASRKLETGVHLLEHEKLLIGTRSTVRSFSGAGGGVLDFDSVEAKVIDESGMTDVPPIIVDGTVIYGRAKGSGVRALQYDGKFGVYTSGDVSGHADHLFVGNSLDYAQYVTDKGIVDWTYSEGPWGLVWACRADGTLLSLTLRGADYGWARHDGLPTSGSLGAGTPAAYLRVCSIPEGPEDAVYMIVVRKIGGSTRYCVERMASRVRRGDSTDDCCVDSAVVALVIPALIVTGLQHLLGESVWVIGTGNAPQGPYVVQQVNTGTVMSPNYSYRITLDTMPTENAGGGYVRLFVGLLFHADLETLDAVSSDSKLKKKTVIKVGFEVDQSVGLLGGQDFDHLLDTRPNTVASGYTAPVPGTELIEIVPQRQWDHSARAVLRQALPLPVTVVGLVRELEVGG